ncbi:MAG: hypothetical protein H8E24_10385 [Verrucomicrobia bacterium]|nr:hypothetical protein [Verrucomicrobiota bacterium]
MKRRLTICLGVTLSVAAIVPAVPAGKADIQHRRQGRGRGDLSEVARNCQENG